MPAEKQPGLDETYGPGLLSAHLLKGELRKSLVQDWGLQRLATIGEACRAPLRENRPLERALRQATEYAQPIDRVMIKLRVG